MLVAVLDAFNFSLSSDQPGVTLTRAVWTTYIAFISLTGWSALNFGITYYLLVEYPIDQLSKLETTASSAQLAMMRYPLTPHFLFLQLNSISTLLISNQHPPSNPILRRPH